MPRPKRDLEKITLNIFAGDKEIIQRFYPNVAYTMVIREIVHNFGRRLEERENSTIKKEPFDDFEL